MPWLAGAAPGEVAGCQGVALSSERICMQQGDWQRAAAQLDSAVAREPRSAEAWQLLDEAREALGRFPEAANASEGAVALDPSRSEPAPTSSWRATTGRWM